MRTPRPLGLGGSLQIGGLPRRQAQFDADLCETRPDVLRMIPDVRRNLAIAAYEQLVENVFEGRDNLPLELSAEDVTDLNATRGQFDTPVITPKGANLLLRMLGAGLIPQKPGTKQSRIAPDLAVYAARAGEIAAKTLEQASRDPEEIKRAKQDEHEQQLERIRHLSRHPEDALPEELNRWTIDKVFLERVGYGAGGTMKLGGMTCHKEVDHWVSNKVYRNAKVIIWWADQSNKRYGDPPFSRPINRRARGGENIHKYNQGLPEE